MKGLPFITSGDLPRGILNGFFVAGMTAVIDATICPSLDFVGVRTGMLLVLWVWGQLMFTGSTVAAAAAP